MKITKAVSGKMRGIAILIIVASHVAEWIMMNGIISPQLERISTWGPIGVDIFFLMSGYALVKSAENSSEKSGKCNGITWQYVARRVVAVYLPYLIVQSVLYTLDGDWAQIDIKRFLIAKDYWFMTVIIVMYVAFMLIWRIFGNSPISAILVTIVAIVLSRYFYVKEYLDFWELSNMAFPMGVCLAVTELKLKVNEATEDKVKLVFWAGAAVTLLLTVMLSINLHSVPMRLFDTAFACEFALNICFTLFVACIAVILSSKERFKMRVLTFIGESSLFIYLIHVRLFWAIMSHPVDLEFLPKALITVVADILICAVIGTIYNKITKR